MRFLLLLCLTLICTACAVQLPGSGRSNQDSGPLTSSVDLDSIPDANPQPVTRTRAGNYSPYEVLGKTYSVLPESHGFVEQGTASWYGRKFHGRLTSNGERFDMYSMTAAHKHLPIPTYVEVTNLDNDRSVILRVNDRGPFHSDRVIDLSWAAAAKLGYADMGTARVRIVALDPDDPHGTLNGTAVAESSSSSNSGSETEDLLIPSVELVPEDYVLDPDSYYQVALLSQRQGADTMAAEVEAYTKFPVRIAERSTLGTIEYRVLIGPLIDRREANSLGLILELAGMSPGFITKLDN